MQARLAPAIATALVSLSLTGCGASGSTAPGGGSSFPISQAEARATGTAYLLATATGDPADACALLTHDYSTRLVAQANADPSGSYTGDTCEVVTAEVSPLFGGLNEQDITYSNFKQTPAGATIDVRIGDHDPDTMYLVRDRKAILVDGDQASPPPGT